MTRLTFLIISSLLLMTPQSHADDLVKKPNVAGQFYPGSPSELARFVDQALTAASVPPSEMKIEMLISPHAGYVYSGGVAAYGYKAIAPHRYSTIVVIGPSHFHDFGGVAIWPRGTFETPLGSIPVDQDFGVALMKKTAVILSMPEVFSPEHSLEVQLPFLQREFKDLKIVPLLMGRPDYRTTQDLASALNAVVGDRQDVLVVISTDLSHYHTYDVAVKMDRYAVDAMLSGQVETIWNENLTRARMEMCGFTSVLVGLHYAKLRGLTGVELLRYANSGDVTGDKSRVVGYSSLVYFKKETAQAAKPTKEAGAPNPDALNASQKEYLLEFARRTIEASVKGEPLPPIDTADGRLMREEGAFVTITKHGELRGCIGRIIGDQPLIKTVRDMAVAAAREDHRFAPVAEGELQDLHVEISVLSTPQKISNPEDIKLGTHGVIVRQGPRGGVFLPQVASETGWNLDQFMGELCSQKAGLPRTCWRDPKTTIEVFTADVF